MVTNGEFRSDLYYRINVIPLTLFPLRERLGDIPLLTDHFVQQYNLLFRKTIERIAPDAMSILLEYRYPGNIRELENILQHAFVLCQGKVIEKKHLPAVLFRQDTAQTVDRSYNITPMQFEKQRIEDALAGNQYNRTRAAKKLAMHPATLWRKMKKYGILGQ
jgi:transcriptional regulator with PAS, ATPase and Fis domain